MNATNTIVPSEARHFGALAADWWDPRGRSAMLHRLNPVRLGYVRDWIDQHWHLDERSLDPLAGKSALDVGCGAGLRNPGTQAQCAELLGGFGGVVVGGIWVVIGVELCTCFVFYAHTCIVCLLMGAQTASS